MGSTRGGSCIWRSGSQSDNGRAGEYAAVLAYDRASCRLQTSWKQFKQGRMIGVWHMPRCLLADAYQMVCLDMKHMMYLSSPGMAPITSLACTDPGRVAARSTCHGCCHSSGIAAMLMSSVCSVVGRAVATLFGGWLNATLPRSLRRLRLH
jgi:hypothetical protein